MKRSFFFLQLIAFLLFGSLTALADQIRYVRLFLDQDIKTGSVSVEDARIVSRHHISEYRMQVERVNADEPYQLGDPFMIRIILDSDDGDFSDIKAGSCLVDNIPAKDAVVSDGGHRLTITYDLPALKQKLDMPVNLTIDRDGICTWDEVEHADKYMIKIQKINNLGALVTAATLRSVSSKVDLSDFFFSDTGDYVYSVQAVSDIQYFVSSDTATLPVSQSFLVDDKMIGYSYRILDREKGTARVNRELVKSQELKIGGHYYRFDETGKWIAGWYNDGNGLLFYDLETHKRRKGLISVGDNRYYLDPDTGYMCTGFIETPSGEMFFDRNGIASHGWVELDGDYFYINEDGSRNRGLLIDDHNRTYLFDDLGRLVRGGLY